MTLDIHKNQTYLKCRAFSLTVSYFSHAEYCGGVDEENNEHLFH